MNRTINYLVIFIYVIACNSVKKTDIENLKKVWQLVEYTNFTKAELHDLDAYLDMTQPENASAKMGCNQLSFPYSIGKNNEIQFSDGIATRMYCPNMKLEDAFSQSITKPQSYILDGNQLILQLSTGEKMVFEAQELE